MAYRKRKAGNRRYILWLAAGICLAAGLFHLYGSWGEGSEGNRENAAHLAAQLSGQGYPESLLELLKRNPETRQFVLDYPDKKDRRGKIDVSNEVERGSVPLFLQWDERWGYRQYGNDLMALNGCGPTCLSMVYCGLSGKADWDPFRVAEMSEQEGYYVSGTGTSWELMTRGAEKLGLAARSVRFTETGIREVLEAGNPIICVVGAGDFTTTGHFLVLTGVDGEGKIRLCDPNSRKNSGQAWELERLMKQIRNLWTYQYVG